MSGRGQSADKHIERTTTYLLQCPASTVPEVMRVCKYSTNKSVNPAKQMAVCRAHKKAVDAMNKASPPNVINALKVGASIMSPTAVTTVNSASPPSTPTTPGGTRPTRSKPKPKLTRKNLRVMQKERVNKLQGVCRSSCSQS